MRRGWLSSRSVGFGTDLFGQRRPWIRSRKAGEPFKLCQWERATRILWLKLNLPRVCEDLSGALPSLRLLPGLRLQMTHLYYERGSRDCAPLKYLIELFSACLSSYPSLGSSSILPAAAHWQTTSCLHLRLQTPWRTTWHDGVCVKCYKSGRLPGTCGELTRLQPWRLWLPSADKALLIQMNSAASKGDLSMCQLPTSHPQISSTGQAGGICRKSSGLVKQHMEDPQ